MKKSRPAVTVSVLCPLGLEPQLVEIMMEETDTLGVRLSARRRQKALSRLITVETKYGEVQVKIGEFKKKVVSVAPEYDFCLRLAKKHGLPLKRVFEEAKTRAKESLQTHRGRQTYSVLLLLLSLVTINLVELGRTASFRLFRKFVCFGVTEIFTVFKPWLSSRFLMPLRFCR